MASKSHLVSSAYPDIGGVGQDGMLKAGGTLQAAIEGTPPEDVTMSRQVSWLAGRCCCLAFPTFERQ
jgi:hypothetical protein